MQKHVLVTGFNGFVGAHLVRALAGAGCMVSGLSRTGDMPSEIEELLEGSVICDLVDPGAVIKLDFAPYDAVINLAGLAGVGASFAEPERYMRINVGVLSNLCEALVRQKLSPRVIAVSSGAVYASDQPMPLHEDSRIATTASPYTKSKQAMEAAALEYRSSGLPDCIIVRPFNHFGPGQKAGFIVPDMYAGLVEAVSSGKPLKVGNLSTRRDYTDVRDVVKAYVALVMAEQLDEPIYNVCSGVSRSGEEILNAFQELIPGADKVQTELDPGLIRPTDPAKLVGNNERIREASGWRPTIPFQITIADFIASERF
jgi:GDP-4-dehydro-6-deoxy-D-mannose reductase